VIDMLELSFSAKNKRHQQYQFGSASKHLCRGNKTTNTTHQQGENVSMVPTNVRDLRADQTSRSAEKETTNEFERDDEQDEKNNIRICVASRQSET
jgi:hypothetical protein